MSDGEKFTKLTKREIMIRGSIIAVIISVPSLIAFVLVWIFLDDMVLGAILGAVIHFKNFKKTFSQKITCGIFFIVIQLS